MSSSLPILFKVTNRYIIISFLFLDCILFLIGFNGSVHNSLMALPNTYMSNLHYIESLVRRFYN